MHKSYAYLLILSFAFLGRGPDRIHLSSQLVERLPEARQLLVHGSKKLEPRHDLRPQRHVHLELIVEPQKPVDLASQQGPHTTHLCFGFRVHLGRLAE